MSTTQQEQFYLTLLASHKKYWEDKRPLLEQYMNAYQSTYWRQDHSFKAYEKRIETPDAFNTIEQYVTTLFLKQPSVVMKADPLYTNPIEPIQILVNRWLLNRRTAFENATRLTLLNTASFVKLYQKPYNEKDPLALLEAIHLEALSPWDVIVDREADSFETQRFIAHVYQLPLGTAKKKFPGKQWKPNNHCDYFAPTDSTEDQPVVPDAYRYVTIVEFFDLIEDKQIIFTPDGASGYSQLSSTEIPVRTSDDAPMIPLIQLYFAWRPDKPMVGIASMDRVFHLIKEKNDLRTYMANAVRSNTRKYIANSELFTEGMASQFQSNIDGQVILIDPPENGQPINLDQDVIKPIEFAQVTTDYKYYSDLIEGDLSRSTLLAPFARGEVTNTTATEINVLSQYSSSEAGKMGRQKDECVERVAEYYVRFLYTLMDDKAQFTIESPVGESKEGRLIGRDDLSGKFQYAALDQGSTPISAALKKQQLVELSPLIMQLKAAGEQALLKELVRRFELPEEVAVIPVPEPTPEAMNIEQPIQPGALPMGGELGTV